jgi:Tfp pilus assembly protein PilE
MNHNYKNFQGYTLVELVVVSAGLVTLAAIATPNVINFVQEGRADEAKAIVNAAVAECIREANQSQTAVADITPQIFIGSNPENKLPTGYSFAPGTSGKCDMIAIYDKKSTADNKSHLPTYIAEVCHRNINQADVIKSTSCYEDGIDPIAEKGSIGVIKSSEYNDDSDFTKNECKKWATTEPKCYAFKPGQLAQLAEGSAKRRERERGRKQCFDIFNAAIANKFDGPFNDPRCEKNLYLLDGQEYTDKEQYEIAKKSKQEKEALAKYKSWLSGPPPGDGKYSDASVGKWGAFEGTEVKDEVEYLVKQREKQENEFEAQVQLAKANNWNGIVEKYGMSKWTYNGREFNSEADWQKARTPVVNTPKQPDSSENVQRITPKQPDSEPQEPLRVVTPPTEDGCNPDRTGKCTGWE